MTRHGVFLKTVCSARNARNAHALPAEKLCAHQIGFALCGWCCWCWWFCDAAADDDDDAIAPTGEAVWQRLCSLRWYRVPQWESTQHARATGDGFARVHRTGCAHHISILSEMRSQKPPPTWHTNTLTQISLHTRSRTDEYTKACARRVAWEY